MLDVNDLYQQRVSTCAKNFVKVILNPLELKTIDETVQAIIAAKNNETAHKRDNLSETKRWTNGLKGEFAVIKYLKLELPEINLTAGVSVDFDIPDIPGYTLGVKTVEFGHFPVISKVNKYPQIICICHPTSANIVYICGLAEINTLQNYQHDDLILDPNLKSKGTKTGFFGFSQLKEVSKDTIEPYKKGGSD